MGYCYIKNKAVEEAVSSLFVNQFEYQLALDEAYENSEVDSIGITLVVDSKCSVTGYECQIGVLKSDIVRIPDSFETELANFFKKLESEQVDLPPDFAKVLSKHFWELG